MFKDVELLARHTASLHWVGPSVQQVLLVHIERTVRTERQGFTNNGNGNGNYNGENWA